MLFTSVLAGLFASAASAAQLQQVQYPSAPQSRATMWVYVPDNVVENPPLVVAVHSCQSSAQAYFQNAKIPWHQGSDGKGYITLWPSSSTECWDVSSRQSLTRDGGGDSTAIGNMVKHAIETYKVDPERVFLTGGSSGGMMSNVLAATYPDIFKAVSLYSGVPAGCFVSSSGAAAQWNNTCSGGQSHASAEQWGDVVRAMYPDYDGPRPRMQIWHGSVDSTLSSNNYAETIKQWTNVFGLPEEPVEEIQNFPQPNYVTQNFGEGVQGIWAVGVGHSVPSNLTASEEWFGL